MKFQLLPSTFDENRVASPKQHLACFVIDDFVALDAGSLAMASNKAQKKQIRNIVLTHAHLDHIAGLPLFIDDLFAQLSESIRIYATVELIEILERDIFNWEIYPRFSELTNDFGKVLEYFPIKIEQQFSVRHLSFKAIKVNHQVPSVGFVVSDGKTTFALTGDTTEIDEFWEVVNNEKKIDVLFIECALPDEMEKLANRAYHLTPKILQKEIAKFRHPTAQIFVINLKPMYRAKIVEQVAALNIENLEILEVGRVYDL